MGENSAVRSSGKKPGLGGTETLISALSCDIGENNLNLNVLI